MAKRERLTAEEKKEFREAKLAEKAVDKAFRDVARCVKEGNCPGDPIKTRLHRSFLKL